jgi:hypothetical protein
MSSSGVDQDAAGDRAYDFKPSLLGAVSRFTLKPEALYWEIGRRSGRVAYDQVRAVRLSYRPVTMQSHRFVTEIWSDGNPKMQIVSVSWRSLTEQSRQDAAYSGFVTELHRRIAIADAATQFMSGLPLPTYWIGLVVFTVALLAIIIMFVRTTSFDRWGANALIAAIVAALIYQFGRYFRRNRPRHYRGDAIPRGVLPGT